MAQHLIIAPSLVGCLDHMLVDRVKHVLFERILVDSSKSSFSALTSNYSTRLVMDQFPLADWPLDLTMAPRLLFAQQTDLKKRRYEHRF